LNIKLLLSKHRQQRQLQFEKKSFTVSHSLTDVDLYAHCTVPTDLHICPYHLITSQYANLLELLIQHVTPTSGSLQGCNCALKLYSYNILITVCQNLSSRALNVVLAETTQLSRLFHILITLLEKLNFRKSSYIVTPLVTCAFFDKARCNTCLIFQ